MNVRGYQQYKQDSVNTMTQGELLLLLLDELVKRVMRCGIALDKGDYALLEQSCDRSMDIIRYLDDTLDHKYPVSHDLHRMYDYFLYELNRVKIGRNKAELDVIRPMITDLRDTFRIADKNSGETR